jgi:hypothetical protein
LENRVPAIHEQICVVLGIWHGLFFVPVALSLIGPKSYKESRGQLGGVDARDKDDAELGKGTFNPRLATPV